MLTKNAKNIIRLLLTAFNEDYSINQIAKKCTIAPNGALKILRKFEKEGILVSKNIANLRSFKLNFDNEKTKNIIELALIEDLEGRVKFRFEDLKPLKSVTQAGIIFGSYIDSKSEPNDLDILFIIEKKNYKKYNEEKKKIYSSMPIKVHDILQTEEDLKNNILNKDKVIVEIFKKGLILWGHKLIIESIENGYKR